MSFPRYDFRRASARSCPRRLSPVGIARLATAVLCAAACARGDHEARPNRETSTPARDGNTDPRTPTTSDATAPAWRTSHVLRVCADPNNLPFSNEHGAGFENKLAELIARDLNARVEYTWWAQRRGFIRNTLKAGRCDVVMGIPAQFGMALPTAPYYRSTYVFVTRARGGVRVRSLDDPALRHLSIGLHTIGDDYANTPAAQALARRGIIRNVIGYSIYGDYSKPDPPADLVRAVARGKVDVAVVWGPLAGYFAKRSAEPLRLTPVEPQRDAPGIIFTYDIAAGARRGDTATQAMLDRELARHRDDIRRLLDAYGIPAAAPGEPGRGT